MFNKIVVAMLAVGAMAQVNAKSMDNLSLELGPSVLNTELSSASGLVSHGKALYAVGDDSPWLFKLNQRFNIKDKHLIKDYPMTEDGRIVKAVKPDYEAMAMVEHELKDWFLVLGSGSKAEVREWGYMIAKNTKQQIETSLAPLYAQLYQAGGFSGDQELNIEGLAIAKDKAFIFNRGNSGGNLIFMLDKAELVDYMVGKTTQVTELKTFNVTLPTVAGFEAGLSGGEFWVEGKSLVYTASVEATGDAYNDGEILGSFIGLIPLKAFKKEQQNIDLTATSVPLLNEIGEPIITKVESIAIVESDKEEISGALVSDNDDGTSEFFSFELEVE
ncbi:hypothetical protein Q4519_10850 [Motilimonas sp. 1_MG-2023]|uniref:Uncharacterized protein n=1 Tax=Motilimonas cestriensis TaxID=2742685 RepID=A0ABS8W6H7_9GAMM|nr:MULTISPECIES: hypothetical protein [Motilimonas]MCE2593880.1 hypothetical protein [Motilimonas cestriensis]MDO6526180.1 hypothetical protein [Motilimonas sp. 1_MG-2023]